MSSSGSAPLRLVDKVELSSGFFLSAPGTLSNNHSVTKLEQDPEGLTIRGFVRVLLAIPRSS